jgi:uncharacterized protein YcbK (DUF882 family)
MASGFGWGLVTALSASLSASSVATPVPLERRAEHTSGLSSKKAAPGAATPDPAAADPGPVLATLADTHTTERVPLDEQRPDGPRFDRLLADRVTGALVALDPRLLELLRTLARAHEGARIELVSGYRSPKLNEMLRKKGHHVASHSQHSLGHAVDFRIVPEDAPEPVDPRALEHEVRAAGWSGGTGVYLAESDRFVHVDVGPDRRWNGQ